MKKYGLVTAVVASFLGLILICYPITKSEKKKEVPSEKTYLMKYKVPPPAGLEIDQEILRKLNQADFEPDVKEHLGLCLTFVKKVFEISNDPKLKWIDRINFKKFDESHNFIKERYAILTAREGGDIFVNLDLVHSEPSNLFMGMSQGLAHEICHLERNHPSLQLKGEDPEASWVFRFNKEIEAYSDGDEISREMSAYISKYCSSREQQKLLKEVKFFNKENFRWKWSYVSRMYATQMFFAVNRAAEKDDGKQKNSILALQGYNTRIGKFAISKGWVEDIRELADLLNSVQIVQEGVDTLFPSDKDQIKKISDSLQNAISEWGESLR